MKISTIINITNEVEKRDDVYLLTIDDDTHVCSSDYIEYKLKKEIENGTVETMSDICTTFNHLFGNTYSLKSMNKHIVSLKI